MEVAPESGPCYGALRLPPGRGGEFGGCVAEGAVHSELVSGSISLFYRESTGNIRKFLRYDRQSYANPCFKQRVSARIP